MGELIESLRLRADMTRNELCAGICNERGNVFGLMPHPERVCDGIGGNNGTDGVAFFTAIASYAKELSR